MNQRPRLLDLFCGGGGAAMGYSRAGFDVVGVDIADHSKHYPFEFVRRDAMEFAAEHGRGFDAIHASPPCQAYTHASFTDGNRAKHPDLLAPVRSLLLAIGRPYIIENVPGAPMGPAAVTICGLMFGLKVFRHRWFEGSFVLWTPAHPSHRGLLIGLDGMCCVVGHGGGVSRRMRAQVRRCRHGTGGQQTKAEWEAAMGIDWMTRNQLSQSVPPAYTQFLGRQLISYIESARAACDTRVPFGPDN